MKNTGRLECSYPEHLPVSQRQIGKLVYWMYSPFESITLSDFISITVTTETYL